MAYRTGVTLQFGILTFPVDINSASTPEEVLSNVCVGVTTPHPPSPIRQNPACVECGNTNAATFKKARRQGKTGFILLEASEVAATKDAAIGITKQIIQLTAHPAEEVHGATIQGKESVYYLTPANKALAVLYGLLADTMRRHPEVAFCGLWTAMSRTGFYEVKLFGDTLVMEPRARAETLKIVQQDPVAIPAENQKQTDALLASTVKPFNPATYADTYKASLDDLIASKQAQEGLIPAARAGSATTTLSPAGGIDLTALLAGALASVTPTTPVTV